MDNSKSESRHLVGPSTPSPDRRGYHHPACSYEYKYCTGYRLSGPDEAPRNCSLGGARCPEPLARVSVLAQFPRQERHRWAFRAAPRSTDPQSVMPRVQTVTEGVISACIGRYAPLHCAYPGANHQA